MANFLLPAQSISKSTRITQRFGKHLCMTERGLEELPAVCVMLEEPMARPYCLHI